jgi:hypothetical protein
MNKHRNALFKSSKETSRRLAKEAVKNGSIIEEEGTFPIYMVVLSHDKNDDILIIHPTYSFEPFQNGVNNFSELNVDENPTNVKKIPGDKPLRIVVDDSSDKHDNVPNSTADEYNIDC